MKRRWLSGEDTLRTRCYPLRRPIGCLGEWLVRRGLLSRGGLFQALDVSYRHDCRLGDAVVWLHLLDRDCVEREAVRFACFANRDAASNIPS